jgi:hypothetical protein
VPYFPNEIAGGLHSAVDEIIRGGGSVMIDGVSIDAGNEFPDLLQEAGAAEYAELLLLDLRQIAESVRRCIEAQRALGKGTDDCHAHVTIHPDLNPKLVEVRWSP